MTPTRAFWLVLLGIFMQHLAHATESDEITLHNDDAPSGLSVVRNWTLICEELCGFGLSGPACGSDCTSSNHSADAQSSSEDYEGVYNISTVNQEEFCGMLCENGLGENRCECTVNIMPAAYASYKPINRNKVCAEFCRTYHVTLRGCSRCHLENIKKDPPRKKIPTSAAPAPLDEVNILRQRIDFVTEPLAGLAVQLPTTDAPTTPDWSRLCGVLCRQGNGGILCNCDLAPF